MEAITFAPLYMERVWGGRELERFYGRKLPENAGPIGESWDIVDREDAQSVAIDGPHAGLTLHELWTKHRSEIFGDGFSSYPRFPILIKILDARDDLSLQVHPPADIAKELGGESKAEMWYIADCDPGAKLYVGLKHGVSKADFKNAIQDGSVAECVHVIEAKPGESIFLPSGRLHAIGAGFLIHEIQQNSDTTYRVFDWNRVGLDGKPRDLHIEASLASIDFDDIEPSMNPADSITLAAHSDFKTDKFSLAAGETTPQQDPERFSIISIVSGELKSESGVTYPKGQSVLIPRHGKPLSASRESVILQITLPTVS